LEASFVFGGSTKEPWRPKRHRAIGNNDADRRWRKVCNVLYGKDRLKHGGRSHPMVKRTFLQILSVHSFEKIQLFRAFQDVDDDNDDASPYNQLNLFDT
jgi:hypothetical protein